MNISIRSALAYGAGALAALTPMLSFAAFTAPTAPEFSSSTAANTGEVATGVLQFYLDLVSKPENIKVIGVFIVVIVGLGLARWLKHKLALGH